MADSETTCARVAETVAAAPGASAAGGAPVEIGACRPAAIPMSLRFRLALLLTGYLPALHLLTVAACAVAPWMGLTGRWALGLAPAVLYLAPPLVCAVGRLVFPPPAGTFPVESREFLAWWFHAQCQTLFNRLKFLEEFLRLLPGVYSLWLRLWGARVGTLVYWAPGVTILDRSYLRVGDRVVFGAGARVTPHVVGPDADGRMTLSVAPVTIGDDALLGGYALLTAGCRVGAGATTPALLALPPFSEWAGGRRARIPRSAARPEAG